MHLQFSAKEALAWGLAYGIPVVPFLGKRTTRLLQTPKNSKTLRSEIGQKLSCSESVLLSRTACLVSAGQGLWRWRSSFGINQDRQVKTGKTDTLECSDYWKLSVYEVPVFVC